MTSAPSSEPTRRTPGWLLPAGLALALVALVAGLGLGRGLAADAPEPLRDEVSLGFVRDMSVHHAQAVRMGEVAHRRSTDPVLRYLAFDILSTQQGQIGMMSGWLELSGQPRGGSAPTMAWMGHSGPMPGMATETELLALDRLPVAQMEEQWLRLMIRHHRGAVPMADVAAERAEHPQVATLARKMSAGQAAEVELMQDLLVQRGLAPEPEDTGHSGHG